MPQSEWPIQERRVPRLAIVVPTLNEVSNIGLVLDRIRRSLDSVLSDYEVIVVDDHSEDGTLQAAEIAGRGDHRIRVCMRYGERGLAGAIQYGWKQTDADFLGVIDADLQHPPEILPKMLRAALLGNDVVVASRYATGGSCPSWSRLRRAASAFAIFLTTPLQRRALRVRDPMSGFFLVRRACVRHCAFRKSGFKLLLEVLIRGDLRSSSEVPYAFESRGGGKSKLTLAVALSYLSLLMSLYRVRLFDGQPLVPRPGRYRGDFDSLSPADLAKEATFQEQASL